MFCILIPCNYQISAHERKIINQFLFLPAKHVISENHFFGHPPLQPLGSHMVDVIEHTYQSRLGHIETTLCTCTCRNCNIEPSDLDPGLVHRHVIIFIS